jgi:hypothetical protein
MTSVTDNVFKEVDNMQSSFMGKTYPYWKNIKSPSALGMSADGNLGALSRDIGGLIQYVEVLVSGKGASTTGGPLGNKFFLKTGLGKCTDVATNKPVDRYIYVNNIPGGNIPLISSGMGVNFSEFKGLIPGTMSNLNVLNPFDIMKSFASGASPPCAAVNLETVTTDNVRGSETHFVAIADLKSMDPCWFPNGQNPYNNSSCKETFENQNKEEEEEDNFPKNIYTQLYYASVGILTMFLIYRLMLKK